jgi:hypothetical protein
MDATDDSRSIRVQTVLFNTAAAQVWRLLRGLEAAARHVLREGAVSAVEWAIGDSSAAPRLLDADVADVRKELSALADVSYEFFGANLGSSGGQNRLAESGRCAYVMVLNPDTYPSPRAFAELVAALDRPGVGIAEARQIPLEHPKTYDPASGDTSWASGCCMMVKRALFDQLGGFDAQTFLLHCDDVDFSWRMRAAGHRVVFVPSAAIFHDKRPTIGAAWPAPDAEQYHAVLGRLMLATRWGRPDIVEQTIDGIEVDGSTNAREALDEYRARARDGRIPAVLEDISVAEFIDGEYAVHRF